MLPSLQEAEEHRQAQLQVALRKAEESAKKDKEDKKARILGLANAKKPSLEGPQVI